MTETQPIPQPEMSALQTAAERMAGCVSGSGKFPEMDHGDDQVFYDVYDPARSGSGEEYVISPTESGWYTLVDGRPACVTVRYVTDPEMIDEVLTELDEVYELSRPEAGSVISDGEYERRLAGVNADAEFEENRLAGVFDERQAELERADAVINVDDDLDDEIPGACDISGD